MTFETAVAFVLAREGGFSNNPADPGGATNFGISQRAYPSVDIKALTVAEAKAIYHHDYWLAIGAENLPDDIKLIAFDTAVNSGPAEARRLIALGTPNKMIAARLKHYTDNPNWSTFGKGWVHRIVDLLGAL